MLAALTVMLCLSIGASGVFRLRVASAAGDVGFLFGQLRLNRLQHTRLRCRADHPDRLLMHRADAHLSGNKHAAHIQIMQRIAQIRHLERIQFPRIGQGKSGLRRLDFIALQKRTSFIVSQMAQSTIFSVYSITPEQEKGKGEKRVILLFGTNPSLSRLIFSKEASLPVWGKRGFIC